MTFATNACETFASQTTTEILYTHTHTDIDVPETQSTTHLKCILFE